jgi:hypothetical protein
MRTGGQITLILTALFAGPGLAGCAAIQEVKDTVSAWFGTADSAGAHEEVLSGDLTGSAHKIPSKKILREKARKASKAKADTAESKRERLQKLAHPNKPPPSGSSEAARPQQAKEAQSELSQPAPLRLRTPWPEAPVSGSFSR